MPGVRCSKARMHNSHPVAHLLRSPGWQDFLSVWLVFLIGWLERCEPEARPWLSVVAMHQQRVGVIGQSFEPWNSLSLYLFLYLSLSHTLFKHSIRKL